MKIKLTINGIETELEPAEAKRIYNELAGVFAERQIAQKEYIPVPYYSPPIYIPTNPIPPVPFYFTY